MKWIIYNCLLTKPGFYFSNKQYWSSRYLFIILQFFIMGFLIFNFIHYNIQTVYVGYFLTWPITTEYVIPWSGISIIYQKTKNTYFTIVRTTVQDTDLIFILLFMKKNNIFMLKKNIENKILIRAIILTNFNKEIVTISYRYSDIKV